MSKAFTKETEHDDDDDADADVGVADDGKVDIRPYVQNSRI